MLEKPVSKPGGKTVAIEVQCTACGKQLRAPDSQAGRSGRCPSCKSPILVPVPRDLETADAPVPAAVHEPVQPRLRSNSPPITRGFSPLASTMDDDLGLPPPATPAPLNLTGGSNSGSEVQIEPKHWFALQVALKITEWALLVEWVSCGILSLAAIGTVLSSQSGGLAPRDATVIRVMSVILIWGSVGMMVGWVALVTGWVAMLKAWPREKKFLIIANSAAGVAIFTILLVISLGILGAFSEMSLAPSPLYSPKLFTIVGSLATAASLISFCFYLTNIQQLLGRDQTKRQPFIYAGVIGALTAWCLIANLALTPRSQFMIWLLLLSNVTLFVGEFLWLWLINAFTSRDLRVSHAWKRI
jgi:hypothetical protein